MNAASLPPGLAAAYAQAAQAQQVPAPNTPAAMAALAQQMQSARGAGLALGAGLGGKQPVYDPSGRLVGYGGIPTAQGGVFSANGATPTGNAVSGAPGAPSLSELNQGVQPGAPPSTTPGSFPPGSETAMPSAIGQAQVAQNVQSLQMSHAAGPSQTLSPLADPE